MIYNLPAFALFLGEIQIIQKGQSISLHAPTLGLQEVLYDLNVLKVTQQI